MCLFSYDKLFVNFKFSDKKKCGEGLNFRSMFRNSQKLAILVTARRNVAMTNYKILDMNTI